MQKLATAPREGKAFDWQAAFPEVFAQGGFDLVVGIPPYIRQELLSPFKPWLETHHEVFHGMADRYRGSEAEAAERVF